MLIATLCVHLDGVEAQCRKFVAAPVADVQECQRMIRPTLDFIEWQAAEVGSPVIFLGAVCERGNDA